MTGSPGVVLVLDPRHDDPAADRLLLPGGRSLADLVGERATREAGELAGTVGPGPELVRWLSEAARGDRIWCLVDASVLALTTTYGDLVADPRPGPSVLRDERSERVIGLRLEDLSGLAPGQVEMAARALTAAKAGSSLDVLAGALQASGLPLRPLLSGAFPVGAVTSGEGVDLGLLTEPWVDEAALRLRRASRADDGFLSTFLVRPMSRRLSGAAVRVGLKPWVVTAFSFVLGALAAGAYAGGSLAWRLVGSVLLLGSLVVDCVDGEVARYTRTMSPLGGWVDVASDRAKEYAAFAGLALGTHSRRVWELAAATFVVLLLRHVVDFGYAVRGGGYDRVARWSERTSRVGPLFWAKKAVALPVGERTLVLVVLAPAVGGRWTLLVLLVLALVAAAYMTVGRVARRFVGAAAAVADDRADQRLRVMSDLGPLARWAPRLDGRAGWLLPAACRLVEHGGLLLLVGLVHPRLLPAAYGLLVVVALHQYDVVYRQRLAPGRPDADLLAGPGWVLRGVVVVVVLALPATAGQAVLWAAAATWGLLAVADSVRFWRHRALLPPARGRWLPPTARRREGSGR